MAVLNNIANFAKLYKIVVIPRFIHIISVRAVVLALVCAVASLVPALARKVDVAVTDSVTAEGVPYAAVYVVGTGQGALTDDHGRASLDIHEIGRAHV